MIDRWLAVLALLGTGVVAGVMFAVALSVVPALNAMPAGRYIYAHRLIGKNWDPTLPVIVMGTTVLMIALAIRGQTGLYTLASVLMIGVSIVSHFCNVPINKRVKIIDPDDIPADWRDPRPQWRGFHLTRTALAVFAFVLNVLSTV